MARRYADLTAQVTGSATTFTLPLFPGEVVVPGSVRLFTAGLSQRPNIAGGGFFDESLPSQVVTENPPDVGDNLEAEWDNTDGVSTLQASGVDPFL